MVLMRGLTDRASEPWSAQRIANAANGTTKYPFFFDTVQANASSQTKWILTNTKSDIIRNLRWMFYNGLWMFAYCKIHDQAWSEPQLKSLKTSSGASPKTCCLEMLWVKTCQTVKPPKKSPSIHPKKMPGLMFIPQKWYVIDVIGTLW
jgi:hypothetical protein